MVLLQTPRSLFAVATGLAKRQSISPQNTNGVIGFGIDNPYKYTARAGIWDWLLHLNNCAFVSHAELSRWELFAFSGILGPISTGKYHMVLTSNFARYRREIAPFNVKFQVDSSIAAICPEEREIWWVHNFRYPEDGSKSNCVRAQIVARAVLIEPGKGIADPYTFFRDKVGVDQSVLDKTCISKANAGELGFLYEELFERAKWVEGAYKAAAAEDDKTIGVSSLW